MLGFIFYGFSILFLNFFTSINVIINSIFIICSIIFVIFFKKKYLIEISKLIIASSLIVLFLVSYSKINDPDAFLYHLPYTQILNEQKIIFGLSNLHFRFGTISLEQYINAGNFNFIKNPGVIISSASIFSIIFMKIFINIYNHLKKIKFLNGSFLILNLFLIFILSIRFNRFSDYGNDAVTSFYLIYLILIIFQKKLSIYEIEDYLKVSLVSIAIFMFKPFYVLLIIIPFLIFIFNKKIKLLTKFNSFLFIFLIIWFLKNIIVSGCVLYPVEKTCLKNLSWYLDDKTNSYYVKNISISGEAYAKSWNTQKKLDQQKYIENFNWLSNWIDDHLNVIINKSQYAFYYFLIILFLSILKYYYRFQKDIFFNLKNLIFKNYIFCGLIIGYFLIWFLKFPIFRYAYIIVFMLYFFLIYVFSSKKLLSRKLAIFTLILSSSVFLSKNTIRIVNTEIQQILPNINNISSEKNLATNVKSFKNLELYKRSRECGYYKSPCTHIENIIENLEISKKNGYYILSIKSS